VNATITVLWPLYSSTCVSRPLQLRTGGFCWCKVLLPTCPCWQQPAHSDKAQDAGVSFNSVIYTVSITSTAVTVNNNNIKKFTDHQNSETNMRHFKVQSQNTEALVASGQDCLNRWVLRCHLKVCKVQLDLMLVSSTSVEPRSKMPVGRTPFSF